MTSNTPVEQALRAVLRPTQIATDEATRQRYSRDAFRAFRSHGEVLARRELPLAVVRPTTTDEVVAVVRLAVDRGLPIVPYGAGSGLMGGALSTRAGIVLDLGAMNRIIAVRTEDLLATAQPGVVLQDLQAALTPHGLLLGHDPWTFPVATLGGAVSTNGLGYRGGRYGGMGDQVRGLEVVLGDGRVVRTKPLPRASVGPDLTQLFIGAEGTLGIITEITIQVFRAPEAVWRRAYQFRSFEDGFRTIEEIWATGLRPSLLEFGDRFAVPGTHWGRAEPPTLFIGFEGFSEEVDACARRTAKICGTALDLGTAAVEAFWRDRHQAAVRFAIARNEQVVDQPAGLPPSARLDYLHVTLPSSQVVPFRARAMQTFANAGALVTETGIWTRPELFSMVVVQLAPDGAGVPPLADTVDAVLKLAQDAGGAMEYCHGVGAALTHLIEREHGAAGLGVLRQVKQACDPFDVLNPGKLGLDGDRRSQGQR